MATLKGDDETGQHGEANMEEVGLNEDTSFTVKIQAPGIEPINFQVLNPITLAVCNLYRGTTSEESCLSVIRPHHYNCV